MRSKRPNRYYVQLLALSFVLVSLPVLLLGVLSYGKSSEVVLKKVGGEKQLGLEQTQLAVEQTLRVVDQATTHFLGSKLIASVLREPLGPDQFQLYNQVRTELTNLQRLDTGISEIRMWSSYADWYISNDGLFRLEAWKKGHPGGLPDKDSGSGLTGWSLVVPQVNGSTGIDPCSRRMILYKKLPLASYDSLGMAAMEIPACQLGGLFAMETPREPVYLFNEKMELIFSNVEAEGELTDSLIALLREDKKTRQEVLELKTDGAKYAVGFRISDYNGWLYASAVPLHELYRESREIGWFTFYICMGLLLLFIVLALFGSKRLYRPVRTMVSEIMAGQQPDDEAGSKDEFAFIGRQVKRLFSDKKQLELTVSGQSRMLRTFFMIRMFLGGMKKEEVLEQLDGYGMSRCFDRLCVLAVQIGDLQPTRFEEKDRDLLLFAVNNVIGEMLPADRMLEPIVLGRIQLTVWTAAGMKYESLEDEAYQTARLVCSKLEELLSLPVLVGLSTVYADVSDIPRAHEEAVEALRRHPAFGGQSIVRFADLGENHTLHYAYPHELQEELFQAIKLLERDRALAALDQLLSGVFQACGTAYDQQFHLVRLLMSLLGLANSIAKQAIPIQRQQSLLDELFQLKLPGDGAGWFAGRLVEPMMAVLEEQTEVRYLAVAKEMIQMVQDEFETDLTLDSCADRLHYNADYAGTIFRKAMDLPFSTYLAQYRHQMALRWLRETDMPVKDMAERLRYNNPQNFIRSFRKQEGVSPGKFRELFKETAQTTDTGDREGSRHEN